MKTDDLIQRTLKTKFKKQTIITIAHRLNTIADYDQIIVMDNGRIA
jgi:ABC-type multidrug transport system fused ATPase/permease subunit